MRKTQRARAALPVVAVARWRVLIGHAVAKPLSHIVKLPSTLQQGTAEGGLLDVMDGCIPYYSLKHEFQV
jgi:hypothetical protein